MECTREALPKGDFVRSLLATSVSLSYFCIVVISAQLPGNKLIRARLSVAMMLLHRTLSGHSCCCQWVMQTPLRTCRWCGNAILSCQIMSSLAQVQLWPVESLPDPEQNECSSTATKRIGTVICMSCVFWVLRLVDLPKKSACRVAQKLCQKRMRCRRYQKKTFFVLRIMSVPQ